VRSRVPQNPDAAVVANSITEAAKLLAKNSCRDFVQNVSGVNNRVKKFEKRRGDFDMPDHFYYTDREEGFGFEVQTSPDLGSIVTAYLLGQALRTVV
jgi:hypothetical protein